MKKNACLILTYPRSTKPNMHEPQADRTEDFRIPFQKVKTVVLSICSFLSLKQQIIFSFGLPDPVDEAPALVFSVSLLPAVLPGARCLPY